MTKQPGRNWWKVGFFVALLAFELIRELYVFQGAQPMQLGALYSLNSFDGYTQAQGVWRRIDGGGELVPATVTIECWKDRGRCQQITTHSFDHMMMPPQSDEYEAKFEPGLISLRDDTPACVTYSIRIDLENNQVFSVRQRKPGQLPDFCDNIEQRMELKLSNGIEDGDMDRDWQKVTSEHFLPLLVVFHAVAKIIG